MKCPTGLVKPVAPLMVGAVTALIVILAGCSGTRAEVVAGSDYLKLGLPPRGPDQVALLLDAPRRPYVTLAIVRAEAATFGGATRSLKERAGMLGADAICDLAFHERRAHSTGWSASYGHRFGAGIRYSEPMSYAVVTARAVAYEPLAIPSDVPADVISDLAAQEAE